MIQLSGPLHLRFGDLQLFTDTRIALEFIHLHQQHVDECIEVRTGIHRILHDHGLHLRGRPQRLERILPRGLFAIELIDHGDDRLLMFAGIAGLNFGSHLETVLRIEQHDSHVGHFEGRKQTATKIVRSGRVEDIQFSAVVFGKQNRRVDRTFVKMLHFGIIRQGIF